MYERMPVTPGAIIVKFTFNYRVGTNYFIKESCPETYRWKGGGGRGERINSTVPELYSPYRFHGKFRNPGVVIDQRVGGIQWNPSWNSNDIP
ncbi:hypothetical protein CHS0354_029742 [Potamilus streckersoni]|uniref:Uncharacterized protein n=1 Tax=Potamilus streckersoni TaxID=2493646 RepID=A0AAE0TH36_9BIVA|nr:hypothetical protein CHS0354_029742 [Potamilus streckersoni]